MFKHLLHMIRVTFMYILGHSAHYKKKPAFNRAPLNTPLRDRTVLLLFLYALYSYNIQADV